MKHIVNRKLVQMMEYVILSDNLNTCKPVQVVAEIICNLYNPCMKVLIGCKMRSNRLFKS
jgi:hypothetical protein